MQDSNPGAGHVEITSPHVFTPGAILIIAAFGVLLAVPVMASLVAVTVIKLGILTVLIPGFTIAVSAYFLPLALGNPIVKKLVRSVNPEVDEAGFIVQMTLTPRIRSGLRALIEDADDLGCLRFTASELVFEGDSVRLRIPWQQIADVRSQNIGWRGRYVYGSRIMVTVAGMSNFETVNFSERTSLLLPTSKRITRKLHERICAGWDSARNLEKSPVTS